MKEIFESYVKDALTHLYDPVHLQTHPLTELLGDPTLSAAAKAASLRQILLDAIESLRPDETISYNRLEWLGYRVLRQRYIDASSPDDVGKDIGLSRASVFKYQGRAVAALASVLWSKRRASSEPMTEGSVVSDQGHSKCSAQSEAVKIATTGVHQWVDLADALLGSVQTVTVLASQKGVTVDVSLSSLAVSVYAEPAMLHQIIVGVLTELIDVTDSTSIACTLLHRDAEVRLSFRTHIDDSVTLQQVEGLDGLAMSRSLLEVFGSRVGCMRDPTGVLNISFAMPTSPSITVLVIDDEPEAVRLYSMYLRGRNYALHQAHTAKEMEQCLAMSPPDVILLDVLMPGEDGWSILQRLRESPSTRDIPVVICSVLNQARLAVALGAAAVLQKPINQEALLRTVEALASC